MQNETILESDPGGEGAGSRAAGPPGAPRPGSAFGVLPVRFGSAPGSRPVSLRSGDGVGSRVPGGRERRLGGQEDLSAESSSSTFFPRELGTLSTLAGGGVRISRIFFLDLS